MPKKKKGNDVEPKLRTRNIAAHERSLDSKLGDLSEIELQILRDYLRHIDTNGQEGNNPARAGASEHRTKLKLNKVGGWSDHKFRGRAKKVATIAFQARDEEKTSKLKPSECSFLQPSLIVILL